MKVEDEYHSSDPRKPSECLHSTGPKSPEGKLASSRNATRHGLAGVFAVLPHENAEDFDHLAARLRDEFQPDNE
jgi:hypothetical protein